MGENEVTILLVRQNTAAPCLQYSLQYSLLQNSVCTTLPCLLFMNSSTMVQSSMPQYCMGSAMQQTSLEQWQGTAMRDRSRANDKEQ